MVHFRFIFRQIARSRQQAAIFVLCVALSLLILASLGGFSSSVRSSMLKDARQLHGADITIHSHYPFSGPLREKIAGFENQGLIRSALIIEFYSMAGNPARDQAILSQLKVVEDGYPFYGRVTLASGREFREVLTPGSVIVEPSVLDRLQAEVGDRLKIGSAWLTIGDVVLSEPDRPVSFFAFGPRIFINDADLDRLDLIKKGSRIQYNFLLKTADPGQVDLLAEQLSAAARQDQERVTTFRNADSRVKRFFDNFLFFLNLIGIFILLLAGIGIQTSLRAILRESNYTIAVMKSVGATSGYISTHFIGMILLLGAAGTVLGLVLSYFLQLYFPVLFAGILPADTRLAIAWGTVFEGLILGAAVVFLFSFLPLRLIKHLKPAYIFRKETGRAPRGALHYTTIILILLFFAGLVIWQIEDIKTGIYFVLGLIGLIGFTAAITQGFLMMIRRKSPRSLLLRQAFRGLFRPGSATRSIIITLSVSLAVIFSIYLIDRNLRETFIHSYPPDLPNAYFLDIQPDQLDEFRAIVGQGARYYPIIRARLTSINNRTIDREKERDRKRDNLGREFNLTYRDHLLDDERMLAGKTLFDGPKPLEQGEIPVSVLDTIADIGDIRVGDLLVFNVQGIPLRARVTSLRTRIESRVRPFFYFVFPEETLQDAPRTIFSAAKMDRDRLSGVRSALTAALPNISVIDIGHTIEVLAGIMGRMSAIIRFFTSFSILAGVLIMISSIIATRLARIREAVYFKILGARSSFILGVFTCENLLIGLSCSMLAVLISQVGSFIICRRILAIEYHFLPVSTLIMIGATLLLVVGVGIGASISVLQQKPVNFLRDEELE